MFSPEPILQIGITRNPVVIFWTLVSRTLTFQSYWWDQWQRYIVRCVCTSVVDLISSCFWQSWSRYKWHCWGCTTIIFPCIFRSFFKNETTTKGLSTFPKIENGIYPDASKWSTEDVVQFFTSIGFKDQSEAFRDQVEIPIHDLLRLK